MELKLGEKLKNARETHNLSLADIEEKTKIRKKYLKAIENNNFESIPGEVYIKAFIREYAEVVGLDGGDLVKAYNDWIKEKEKEKEKEKQQRMDERKDSKTFLQRLQENKYVSLLIIIILIVTLAIFTYFIFFKNNEDQRVPPDTQETEQITEEAGTEETKDSNSTLGNKDNEQANEDKNNNEKSADNEDVEKEIENNLDDIKTEDPEEVNVDNEDKNTADFVVISNDRSWLQINVDGEMVFQGFVEKGEQREYNADEEFEIKIGNAEAIQVRTEEETLGPWGERGEVVRKQFKVSID